MNQMGSLMRYHGRRLGLHPQDENLAWEVDSFYDFFEDYIERGFVDVVMKGSDVKNYEDAVKSIVDEIGRRLKHGKKYLCGDKITTADFVCAHLFFSWIENPHLGGPPGMGEKGRAILKSNQYVVAYCHVMRTEVAAYLAIRPPAPV